ncbi:MAG: glycosyltransferase [Nitrospira sp.]|nr:glycosyltransferase [Nitrospira sp.]
MREAVFSKALAAKDLSSRLASKSVAGTYQEYFWPPNQVLTTELPGDLEFHHTAPFPSLQRPFVLHCEMFAPVWFPFSQQGSGGLDRAGEIREHYRSIFANPLCLGIFSHVPETLHAFTQFFDDPNIVQKLFSSRIGLSAKAVFDRSFPKKSSLQCPKFLFVNSANQNPFNFFRRGGHIVLRFWKEYLEEGRDGLLMLRCAKPNDEDLSEYGVDVSLVRDQTGRSIIWGQDYLANHEMNALMASTHFFLLPSASLHSASIMQAMALGAIPVVTDTVGTSVYVTDNENGIVLQGMRDAIWHKDTSTGTLIDRYGKTPDLDDSLTYQLTSRVGALLDRPDAYHDMQNHMIAYAQDQFSGQAFSDHLWSTISALYYRYRESSEQRISIPRQGGHGLLDCTVRGDEWARVFESPTQPMLRINTGHSVVWELGGALIHAYGNPPFKLNDWSALAKYYSTGAPRSTFAHTLAELGGKYVGFSKSPSGHSIYGLAVWISGALKPYPMLYGQAARVWKQIRRYHSYFVSRLLKPMTSDVNIELVRHGVSGYNIIRHGDRYYAIPQSEGAFIPAKAESGGYSSCFSSYSLEQVEHAVQEAVDSAPEPAVSYRQSFDRISKL